MRIIVSSIRFAKLIGEIDLDMVKSVQINESGNFEIFYDRGLSLSFPVETRTGTSAPIKQDAVRWDWLHRDLKGIQEQPVCIDFTDNNASFTLNYKA